MTNGSKRKRRFGWILLLLLVVAGAGGLIAVNQKSLGHAAAPAAAAATRREPAAVAVTVAHVTPRPVQRRVQIVGTLYGLDEVEISPKVSGRILRVAHDIGDVVRPGEVLLEIDDTDYRLAKVEVERSLELELSRLGLRALPPPKFDLRTVPTVQRAELLEERTRAALERMSRLDKGSLVTKDQLEQAQTDHRVAQANTRQALLEAEQTLATVRHREALLATAQQKIADATIRVPQPSDSVGELTGAAESGVSRAAYERRVPSQSKVEYVVAGRMVTEGEMVQPSPPVTLFRLVRDQPLKLKAAVPERFVGEVQIGQPVELAVEAFPNQLFAGRVARINPTVDRLNRTFQIEVHIPNESRQLRPGSFVKAAVLTREDAQVPTVPEESLVKFAGVIKVFVVQDGKAHAVLVEPGVRLEVPGEKHTENWFEVRGNLPRGADVVTTGHSQLAEGTPVRVREQP